MKRNESTNDKIVRLFHEGWESERIAEEVSIPVANVNGILERRVEGYADLLAKKSLEANKARTAAKEEALRQQREAEEALEAKQAQYSSVKKKPAIVNPDDFFNSDLDGMLVGNYKQKMNEPEKETVNILTQEENRNLLTAEVVEEDVAEEVPVVAEEVAEEVVVAEEPAVIEEAPVVEEPVAIEAVAPVVEVDANPAATATQKIALFAQAQITENEGKIESINVAIAEIAAKVAESQAENEAVNADIADISGQIDALNDEIAGLQAQIAALQGKMAELQSKASVDNTSSLNEQIAAYNEQITALKAENEQYRALIK